MDSIFFFGILLIVPLFFLLISLLLAFISGWIKLEQAFPDQKLNAYVASQSIFLRSALVGFVGFNNVMRMDVNEKGLRFRCIFPFSITHKPIVVPWNQVKGGKHHQVMFFSYVRLELGVPIKIGTISIMPKAYEQIKNKIEGVA